MKQNKTIGYYFTAIAGILGIVSLIRFLLWAPKHAAMDYLIIAALIIGVVLDIMLFAKDNNFVIIAATVCYTVAGVKLLTNSVGSFVDALQGINMFGDSTQVGTIVSITMVIMISVLLSMIAGFMKREK